MKIIGLVLSVSAIFIISVHGQGFQNLNFELAQNLPGNPGDYGMAVSVVNALPEWTAYSGPNALSSVYYVSNSFPGDSTAVELEGGSLALSGNNLSVGLYIDGSISQTGVVPSNAESLEFEAEGPGPGGSLGNGLAIILSGQSLSYSAISTGPDYILYQSTIPANLVNQTETLSFACEGPTYMLLDNIEFISVPEPSEYALMGLGAILFGFWRCKSSASFASPKRG